MSQTSRRSRWGRTRGRTWTRRSTSCATEKGWIGCRSTPRSGARVIEIQDPVSIKPDELGSHGIGRGERILFKTRNSSREWWNQDFIEDFVYVSQEAGRYLADREVRTVGVDYLSVGGFREDGVETHQALLSAGIWVIEGLNLSRVELGEYELTCLPLKVADGDGAPARAILRK